MGLGRWLLSLSVFLMRRLGEMSWCVALCVGVEGVGVIGASFAVRVPFSWLLHSFRGSSYFGPSSWLRKSILMPSHHWLCPGGSVRGVGRPFVGGLGVADEMDDSEFVDLRALGARSALHAVPVRSHDAHMHLSIPNSASDAIRMEGGIRHAPQ